jgi:hypothetical protein
MGKPGDITKLVQVYRSTGSSRSTVDVSLQIVKFQFSYRYSVKNCFFYRYLVVTSLFILKKFVVYADTTESKEGFGTAYNFPWSRMGGHVLWRLKQRELRPLRMSLSMHC